jgi:transcriptional regulator GlxA family with amidase domain
VKARVGPLRVAVLAIPDAVVSTLSGVYDVMNAFDVMGLAKEYGSPFRTEIVGETIGPLPLASGVPTNVQRAIGDIPDADIVIAPSVLVGPAGWTIGRYPALVEWLGRMHARGALLCSACSGIFLLAETGLFDSKDATVHFAYANAFAKAFPSVRIHPERVLVVSGVRDELVTSGASMTWHDLVLYLVARFAGATAAQRVAHLYALQWHQEGLAPFMIFEGRTDHGDSDILAAQRWLETHASVANPVEEMIARSGLAERTFTRRFAAATGFAPLTYVQRLRVEDAKRRLERTEASVDEISWQVGYEDAAFFRRLFKRVTGLAPGAYRKRFSVPAFARASRQK